MTENDPFTEKILKCAYMVHTELGPGLLESTYEICLFHELMIQGSQVERQVELPLKYRNIILESGYRIDLLVDNKVIVEIKSVESLSKIHKAQLITYLKLSKIKIGLLINFNVLSLRDGIKRLSN